ncbi:hypothetical protein OBBRIDRAFT_874353 [Obba rivulosa]|uniref:Uncharacterized protein n=1 Tax=Obba rivulosa TaxID=1052685 RepID=A0A8E2AHP0_9APHY|nr:hypothetical protein OBBRIDRAFT_874353 [Obba rivulosa]
MARTTRPHLGVGLKLNALRHILIAFRRKHCSAAVVDIEGDEESIEALSSGHSRQQENRTYGISKDMLAGPSEDLIPLYLDASVDWQLKLKVVPGGMMLPYQDAMSSRFEQLCDQGQFADLHARAPAPATALDMPAIVAGVLDQVIQQFAAHIQSAVAAATDKIIAQLAHIPLAPASAKSHAQTGTAGTSASSPFASGGHSAQSDCPPPLELEDRVAATSHNTNPPKATDSATYQCSTPANSAIAVVQSKAATPSSLEMQLQNSILEHPMVPVADDRTITPSPEDAKRRIVHEDSATSTPTGTPAPGLTPPTICFERTQGNKRSIADLVQDTPQPEENGHKRRCTGELSKLLTEI